MFVDYYAILEISETANLQEIKNAFRRKAIKWHPDRNPDRNTTIQMQLINEAYLILKDKDARCRYNVEYQKFNVFKKTTESKTTESQDKEPHKDNKKENQQPKPKAEPKFEYAEYSATDDLLKNWMANAKRQSVDLAKETIKDFKGMIKVGVEEGAKAAGQMFIIQMIIGFIILLIFAFSKSCNS